MAEEVKKIRVGSRKSQLAMIQTNWVVARLQELYPEYTFEIEGISTTGDKILDVALSKIGEKSLFTKELEIALLKKEIDFVVHSLKDLPTQLPDGLTIAAITKREDPRDAVIFSPKTNAKNLNDLAKGSCVGLVNAFGFYAGTSSLRRVAQLRKNYPHLDFIDVRGNLNTRLKKLDDPDGPYHALILATAGIVRMEWQDRIGQYLECEDCMHAVGQGALGIECAEDNEFMLNFLDSLNDPCTYLRCLAERSFMRKLEGGCSVPVAVHSEVKLSNERDSECSSNDNCTIVLKGSVWNLDGSKFVIEERESSISESTDERRKKLSHSNYTSVYFRQFNDFSRNAAMVCAQLGESLGQILLDLGAKDILNEVKASKTK